jgi:hypothetical protein
MDNMMNQTKINVLGPSQAFRVDEATFKFIVQLCKPQLQRVGTNYRESLSTETIVAIGLYKLAHGIQYTPLMHQFGVGRSTAQQACIDFNRAMWGHKMEHIGWKDKLSTLAFFEQKGFPGCLGAIDGCHIPIQRPPGVETVHLHRKTGCFPRLS